ncbi:hypothetical protein ACLOJK_040637 [Asimina triloba]
MGATHPCRVRGGLQAVQRVRWLVADIRAGGRCGLGGIHDGQRQVGHGGAFGRGERQAETANASRSAAVGVGVHEQARWRQCRAMGR